MLTKYQLMKFLGFTPTTIITRFKYTGAWSDGRDGLWPGYRVLESHLEWHWTAWGLR